MIHLYTFVVTTMESLPEQIIRFYCGRGKMENFIKEAKNGFDFSSVSSRKKVVNANCLSVHMLAYNLFNWFRRLVLPARMRKQQVDTIRLKLLKIAARVIHSARYITSSSVAVVLTRKSSLKPSLISKSWELLHCWNSNCQLAATPPDAHFDFQIRHF